jgi:hypothetical protein
MDDAARPAPAADCRRLPKQPAENLGALNVQLSEDQIHKLDVAGNLNIKETWLR